MQAILELPEELYRQSMSVAHKQSSSLEQFILLTLEREVARLAPRMKMGLEPVGRVSLPLVPSRQPGTLDLSQFNFDDLLA